MIIVKDIEIWNSDIMSLIEDLLEEKNPSSYPEILQEYGLTSFINANYSPQDLDLTDFETVFDIIDSANHRNELSHIKVFNISETIILPKSIENNPREALESNRYHKYIDIDVDLDTLDEVTILGLAILLYIWSNFLQDYADEFDYNIDLSHSPKYAKYQDEINKLFEEEQFNSYIIL